MLPLKLLENVGILKLINNNQETTFFGTFETA